jgi:hypothetical protein
MYTFRVFTVITSRAFGEGLFKKIFRVRASWKTRRKYP